MWDVSPYGCWFPKPFSKVWYKALLELICQFYIVFSSSLSASIPSSICMLLYMPYLFKSSSHILNGNISWLLGSCKIQNMFCNYWTLKPRLCHIRWARTIQAEDEVNCLQYHLPSHISRLDLCCKIFPGLAHLEFYRDIAGTSVSAVGGDKVPVTSCKDLQVIKTLKLQGGGQLAHRGSKWPYLWSWMSDWPQTRL